MDKGKKHEGSADLRLPADSKIAAAAAIQVAISRSREEEYQIISQLKEEGIHAVAIDFGGEYISSIGKLIERSVVAARREGLIDATYTEEGAVAGAAREAISQLISKATGLNIGGKIGIVRFKHNVSVCTFFGIGLLHLDEVGVGLGHRAI